jgi:hypothetical protein
MLLIETTVDRITGILESDRPIALVPAESRDRATEIAVAARDGGFGVAVIEDRSERLFVLVVGDQDRQADLRRFMRRFGAEIATDRHVEVVKVYSPASWFTGLAHLQGANIGITL